MCLLAKPQPSKVVTLGGLAMSVLRKDTLGMERKVGVQA